MKILFHVGVGNTDRPSRWTAINGLYSNLAKTFSLLGHDCLVWAHPSTGTPSFSKYIISSEVKSINYKPDAVFTWNGASPGDRQIIDMFPDAIKVYGELGFFNHYQTCYFDFSGTNYRSQLLVEKIPHYSDRTVLNKLINAQKQNRAPDTPEKFVFVPLQDETDTQIKLSSFNMMNEVLEYVLDLYQYDPEMKILYKQHPRAPSNISIDDSKLIEVKGNVHAYIPYADKVIGINSTVLFETLLYHQRILALGIGFASRKFRDSCERGNFIIHCYNRQMNLNQLQDINFIKNSWMYNKLLEKYVR